MLTHYFETIPEEILCKLLENELSAITFDIDQTWSFATQADFRFTIWYGPYDIGYQTNFLYLKSIKGKSRIVPETYTYYCKVQSSYSDSCLDETCKTNFWKKNWSRIWSEFQGRIKKSWAYVWPSTIKAWILKWERSSCYDESRGLV